MKEDSVDKVCNMETNLRSLHGAVNSRFPIPRGHVLVGENDQMGVDGAWIVWVPEKS